MRLETPFMPVWTSKSSTRTSALFVPLTQGFPSERISSVRFGVLFTAPNSEVQPGIQYSADGITWDSAVGIDLTSGSYWVPSQLYWQYMASKFSCPSGFAGPPTQRLFVRFGLWVNNLSGSKVQMGMVKLAVLIDELATGSVSAGPMCTPTGGGNGSVTTELFTPMSEGVLLAEISEIRVSWEMIANSGDVATRPGYQVSKNGLVWSNASGGAEGTFVDPGATPRTSAGITYGTTFSAVSASDYQWIRFGIIAENNTSSNQLIEACQSKIRVDWRGA